MVYASLFLANLFCSYFSCFPTFEPPLAPSGSDIIGTRSRDPNRTQWPIVATAVGQVKGYTMKTIGGRYIYAFEGIPFAEKPIGNLRFRAPVSKKAEKGVINDGSTIGTNCIQIDLSKVFLTTGVEDCLYMNIYTPEIQEFEKFPVLIWFHGGAYLFGSKDQYGPAYLLDRDVILVIVNYRLGVLGFLSTGDRESPGNYGLKDQTMALDWIIQNVHAFGGNRDQITLLGQSAGGVSVHLHMLSHKSRGKFQRGISQSASAFCSWGITPGIEKNSKKLARALHCPTHNSSLMVECLRSIPSNTLTTAQTKLYQWLNYPSVNFGPTVEKFVDKDSFLTQSPENHYTKGDVAKVPWIIGFVPDEGNIYNILMMLNPFAFPFFNRNFNLLAPMTLDYKDIGLNEKKISESIRKFYFGQKIISHKNLRAHANMYGDRFLLSGMYRGMLHHSQVAPTYGYFFNYTGTSSILQQVGMTREEAGITHYDEVRYLFNSTFLHKSISIGHLDAAVAEFMVDLWTNFARTGKPLHTDENGEEIEFWNPVDPSNIRILEINEQPRLIPFPKTYLHRINFWTNILGDHLIRVPSNI